MTVASISTKYAGITPFTPCRFASLSCWHETISAASHNYGWIRTAVKFDVEISIEVKIETFVKTILAIVETKLRLRLKN
jgi:hypothetical protein